MRTEPALVLTDADVAELDDVRDAVDALRDAYRQPQRPGSTPERAVATTLSGWLRIMPSAPTGRRLAGLKVISAAVKNGQVSYLVALFDQESGSLVALVDGNRITGIRTAATAAVAVDALASSDPQTVGIVGSGFEARAQLRALASVREIADVRVFSPTPANRVRFATDMTAELDMSVLPVSSAEEAVRDATLVVCAARSSDESPTLFGEWLSPGALVVSVGSTTASQREVDVSVIDVATLVVADALEEVRDDSGDMLAAREAGIDTGAKTVSLADLVQGKVTRPTAGIVVYKSSGSGFQDIVVTEMLVEKAVAQGLGTRMPADILTIKK